MSKIDDVVVDDRRTVHRGFYHMEVMRLSHPLHEGGMSPIRQVEVVNIGQVVSVLPYDPQSDMVLLVEQFRVGAFAANWHPWPLEAVAGFVDKGETAEAAARRELEEEARLEARDLHRIARFLVSPGGSTEWMTSFCALVDMPTEGGVFGLPEEGEDIRLHPMPAAAALARVGEGLVDTSFTLIALQWLALNRDRLRAEKAA